jgi:hypothetical protein
MQPWAAQELAQAHLGDPRRNRRLNQIVQDFVAHPSASVPQACGTWAKTKAAYRFWASDRVRPDAIRDSHIQSTVARARNVGRVLAVQDTTELDYADHPATQGLGLLNNVWQYGFKVHSTLAVSLDSVPLGLLHQHVWVRDPKPKKISRQRRQRPTRDKESQRWLTAWAASQNRLPPEVGVITVADSEADIFDLFATPRRAGADLLIRGTHNRRVAATAKYLWATVQAQPVRGQFTLEFRRRAEQPARQVRLTVRTATVTLQPPRHHLKRTQLTPVSLNVIWVMEAPPPRTRTPICWLLLTTLPIDTWEQVRQCILWYSYRWLIEQYHFVYKSGCHLEDLQLETAERLHRALATYSLVAWRLLWLTYEARRNPVASCEQVLERAEWQALYAKLHATTETPRMPPTLHQAVRWIAQLGGFLARRSDGEPGVKTIWQGLRRLSDLTEMWQLHHPDLSPPLSTSG